MIGTLNNLFICWLVLGCWFAFKWSYKPNSKRLIIAFISFSVGYFISINSSKSKESGLYSLNLRPVSKWSARTSELGRVRTVWPKEFEIDKNWGECIGYFNNSKNKFYICSRKVESESIQTKYLRFFNNHLDSCNGVGKSFLMGISTGDKSLLSKEEISLFRDAGLSHILAVSGYHVGLVGFIPLMLIRSRFKWVRVSAVMGLAMIWAFIVACGYPVSAIRSGIMITIGFLGFWLDRGALPFNALALSAWIIVVADASAFYNIGTWLSYAATAGILAQVYSSKLLLIRIPIAAQTATLHIITQCFQQLPIFFLPLNIAVSIVMSLVGISIGLSMLYPPLIVFVADTCSFLIGCLDNLGSVVPLSMSVENPNAFIAGSIAGYAWLFYPILPLKLSQIISGTAILVAIFELWIKFI